MRFMLSERPSQRRPHLRPHSFKAVDWATLVAPPRSSEPRRISFHMADRGSGERAGH